MFTFEIGTKETFQLHVIDKIILHSNVYHIRKKPLHTVLLYLGRNIYLETPLELQMIPRSCIMTVPYPAIVFFYQTH